MLWYITFFLGIIITIWAQYRVTSSFSYWSKVPAFSGYTGREVARRILDQHGLTDVKVEPIAGKLTDHYDPTTRTVRLSESVYHDHSIAAIAVAAHECGHALQHQENYGALVFRHRMVPVLQFTSGLAPWFLLAGIFFRISGLLLIGILFFAVAVLFHLVTLPVEFNASARAKKILAANGFVVANEEKGIHQVLRSAAFTYVAGALVALLELFRFLAIYFLQRRD